MRGRRRAASSSLLAAAEEARAAAFARGMLAFEPGQLAELRIGEGNRLEQRAHAGPFVAGQADERTVDFGVLAERGALLERLCAGLDAEPAQERRLVDRAVHLGAQCLRRMCQRLEIDMGGEVDGAGCV